MTVGNDEFLRVVFAGLTGDAAPVVTSFVGNPATIGTAYFEPDDNWRIGGLKCQHGHCVERNVRDLLAYLGVEISAAAGYDTVTGMLGVFNGTVRRACRSARLAQRIG